MKRRLGIFTMIITVLLILIIQYFSDPLLSSILNYIRDSQQVQFNMNEIELYNWFILQVLPVLFIPISAFILALIKKNVTYQALFRNYSILILCVTVALVIRAFQLNRYLKALDTIQFSVNLSMFRFGLFMGIGLFTGILICLLIKPVTP